MAQIVVDAFCLAQSFDATRRRFALLSTVPPTSWTMELRRQIEAAATTNINIRDCVLDGGEPVPAAVNVLMRTGSP